MSDGSRIEWTEATWNPLVGCTKVSPGCDHCYALGEVNRRHAAAVSPKTSPKMLEAFPATFDHVSIRPDRFLFQPLSWTRPRRIFVNSLSDLFHADVPDDFIARVFGVMATAQQHTFQLLTKRHARMRSLLRSPDFVASVHMAATAYGVNRCVWPLPNVWLGVSVEDQHWADIRIPALLETPAAVRWISAEPLLGPIKLDFLRVLNENCTGCHGYPGAHDPAQHYEQGDHWGLDWVVTGGESGAGARVMHDGWAWDIAQDCERAGVAFLHKQNGNYIPDPTGTSRAVDTNGREYPGRFRHVGKHAAGRELHGRVFDGYPEARA